MTPPIGGIEESRASTSNPVAAVPAEADRAEKAGFQRAMETFGPAGDASDGGKAVDFSLLREAADKFWTDFPDTHRSTTLLTYYMDMFAKAHPERVQEEWASFTECRSPIAAELARGKVRFAELSRQPFDLAFIALDGRAVDLRKLRGKVVLVDFWATWCGPCIKQMPGLKRLYAKYHDQGFDIVGISLDRAEDRPKLLEFVAQNGLAWPQHFDGRVWQNEIAVRYAINSAPTTFLIDRDGRLVGVNLEGKLDDEVKRHLSLQPTAPQ